MTAVYRTSVGPWRCLGGQNGFREAQIGLQIVIKPAHRQMQPTDTFAMLRRWKPGPNAMVVGQG